jgi:hypothetical protein
MNRIETHEKAIAILEAIATQRKKIISKRENIRNIACFFPELKMLWHHDIDIIERSIVRLRKKYKRITRELCE